MIIGILKKTGERLVGQCNIVDTIIGGNSCRTVNCQNYDARTYDSIILQCIKCSVEYIKGKVWLSCENFHYCQTCSAKVTSFKRYGVDSPNQLPDVKRKQKKNNKQYVLGKIDTTPKTNNPEELSNLRSQIAKNLWKKGVYDNVDFSNNIFNISKKQVNHTNTLEHKTRASIIIKKLWLQDWFRDKMSRLSMRQSKFQKDVFIEFSKLYTVVINEYMILDKTYSCDIYIPVINQIIECYGEYWHCDPRIFPPEYYHQRVKLTAQQIWDRDRNRISNIEDKLKCQCDIIWERDWKNNKEKIISDHQRKLELHLLTTYE